MNILKLLLIYILYIQIRRKEDRSKKNQMIIIAILNKNEKY